jgi:DNA replication and repair protein RecF
VREGSDRLRVTGELGGEGGRRLPIGVERGPDGLKMRLDGRPLRSALELSNALPLQYLHPDIHQLVQAGPGLRRQFLDRGVFHVEPRFLECWRRYQRALRQRNAALKSGGPVDAWDGELAEQGHQLDVQRSSYLAGLEPLLRKQVERLLGRADVGLVYRRGWNARQALDAVLRESRETDRRQGFTGRGAHRCDFALTLGDAPIRDRVSRGQQKLLLCALQLAQAEWQREVTGFAGLLLVDDLPAELDARHRASLLETLVALETQAFVTATDLALVASAAEAAKLFHVERGEVGEMV